MMDSIKWVLGFVFLAALATAQVSYKCQCGLFVDIGTLPPRLLGPLYELTDSQVACSDAGAETCDNHCTTQYTNWATNTTLDATITGTETSWGQNFCDQIKNSMGGDYESVTQLIQTHSRVAFCRDHEFWEVVTFEPERWLCCDQLGRLVFPC